MSTGRKARKRKSSSRRAISQNLFGGVAVACLVAGCAWTVHSYILSASVYPTLGKAGYDEPIVRRPKITSRSTAQMVSEAFAALAEQAPAIPCATWRSAPKLR